MKKKILLTGALLCVASTSLTGCGLLSSLGYVQRAQEMAAEMEAEAEIARKEQLERMFISVQAVAKVKCDTFAYDEPGVYGNQVGEFKEGQEVQIVGISDTGWAKLSSIYYISMADIEVINDSLLFTDYNKVESDALRGVAAGAYEESLSAYDIFGKMIQAMDSAPFVTINFDRSGYNTKTHVVTSRVRSITNIDNTAGEWRETIQKSSSSGDGQLLDIYNVRDAEGVFEHYVNKSEYKSFISFDGAYTHGQGMKMDYSYSVLSDVYNLQHLFAVDSTLQEIEGKVCYVLRAEYPTSAYDATYVVRINKEDFSLVSLTVESKEKLDDVVYTNVYTFELSGEEVVVPDDAKSGSAAEKNGSFKYDRYFLMAQEEPFEAEAPKMHLGEAYVGLGSPAAYLSGYSNRTEYLGVLDPVTGELSEYVAGDKVEPGHMVLATVAGYTRVTYGLYNYQNKSVILEDCTVAAAFWNENYISYEDKKYEDLKSSFKLNKWQNIFGPNSTGWLVDNGAIVRWDNEQYCAYGHFEELIARKFLFTLPLIDADWSSILMEYLVK